MPCIRIETTEGWLAGRNQALFDGIDRALVEVLGVPPGDSLMRLVCHEAAAIRLPRSADPCFVLMEVSLFAGRSMPTKRALYRALTDAVAALGVAPEQVTVALYEVALENWGIRDGRPASEIVFDFPIAGAVRQEA
jgi:phenylpyruvate tautomerase PptA (4-oxalocrotonate tautomerase family)